MSGGIIIYGDPHGEWRPLLRACAEERPDGVVILGDCDLEARLMERIAPVFDAGIAVERACVLVSTTDWTTSGTVSSAPSSAAAAA